MTRRPFDPNELDQPSAEADRAVAGLESYLADTATRPPHGLDQRVMAAIEQEPAPRRGHLAWLLMPAAAGSGSRRVARAGLLAATLVIAVAGALFAGQLADLVRNVGDGSPTPVESISPPSQSVAPSPTTSPEPAPSASHEASGAASESPEPSGTPDASEDESPEPSSDDSGEESETPRPSATATPTATP
jgi:hypothetical protein